MPNKKLIENLSKFTKIQENNIEEYLLSNDLTTLLEHPETINPTQNQSKNIKDLMTLSNLYNRVSIYKDYKFEKTTEMVEFLDSHYYSKFDKEYFLTAFLDNENKLLGIETISVGTLNASIVHPRDVFKKALEYNAKRIVLSHNHPSGVASPSNEDIRITERLEETGKMFNIDVIDHIIIGKNDFYSFKKEGFIMSDPLLKNNKNKSHELIYKKDVASFSDLLNKVTKIPKTDLKNILSKTSANELIAHPEIHLNQEGYVNSINMLKDIFLRYNNASYLSAHQIKGPDEVKDYIDNKYNNKDKIDVALFLDTKNRVINSIIIPDNLSEHNKFKFIMKNVILHDSNSYILATKDSSLPSMTNIDRVNEIQEIKRKSSVVGITLLDNIEIRALSSVSYKQMNFLEEQNTYKAIPNKIPMQERFKNAIAEADKRNINQNKNEMSKNKEQQL